MNMKDVFLSLTEYTIPFGHESKLEKYLPKGYKKDSTGNYYIQIGESETLFTTHLDTYSKEYEKVNHVIDGDIVKTDGTTILGGDNKLGMCILLYMIDNGVPGTYYFFLGEEPIISGGLFGSQNALDKDPNFFKKFKRAIAFDRKEMGSVVTRQRGRFCCSKGFASSLCDELSKFGINSEPDPRAYYTDTATFLDTISECTNISAGGWNEHYNTEWVDLEYTKKVAKANMTTSEIHIICKKYNIKYYTINDDMSISVNGSVGLAYRNLKSIPITFKEVSGYFSCSNNQLTSLEGCPETVGGVFYCNGNQLTSLEGCPKTVSGNFYCNVNQLTSLEYCPETVGGGFYYNDNQLTSLDYCPETVDGDFSCSNNQLTSLEGCPKTVGGDFYCNGNQLTSLEYCPESVGGSFYCSYNQLTNFDGLPEFFERPIYIYGNPVYEIYRLFEEDHRCIYWLREYDVIMDMTVVKYRLGEVYHTLGMDIPKDIKLKKYILT